MMMPAVAYWSCQGAVSLDVEISSDTIRLPTTGPIAQKPMASAQFEAIMRPHLKDDEWLIILVGAVFGAVVGELQVHALIVPLASGH
jgi:hypothetical protein